MEAGQVQRRRASRPGSTSTDSMGRQRPRKTSSAVVVRRPQSQTPYKPVSGSTSVLGHITRHPDLPQEKLKEFLSLQRDRIAVYELADFLRRTSPPPNNNMCLPDLPSSRSSSFRSKKWDPIKAIRRQRRSLRRRSDPEEVSPAAPAIACRTREGTPHIAISIPKEYISLAARPRTQPSILESKGPEPNTFTRTIVTRGGSVRTYTIEKDPSDRTLSVTTTSRIAARPRRADSFQINGYGNILSLPLEPPPSCAPPVPPKPASYKPNSSRAAARRNVMSQNGIVTKTVAGSTILMHPRASLPHQAFSSSAPTISPPARKSSKHHARVGSAPCDSIAEVMHTNSPPMSWLHDDTSRSQTPVLSIPDSEALSDTDPTTCAPDNRDRQTMSSYSSIPILQRDNRDSFVTVLRDDADKECPVEQARSSPHDTPNSDDGSFTTQKTLEERRRLRQKRVGDKKRKDIDAARLRAKQSAESVKHAAVEDFHLPDGYDPGRKDSQTLPIFEMMMSASRSEFLPKESIEEERRVSMSPIMVVADVNPKQSPAVARAESEISAEGPTTTIQAPKPIPHSKSHPLLQFSREEGNGESTAPQLESPTAIPTRSTPPLDRTSLSRRLEHRWSLAEAQRLRRAASSVVLSDPDMATAAQRIPYDELARRYRMLWARHVSDLERRLGRLEADGDTWLRAVVPLLDGLNRTLGRICEGTGSGEGACFRRWSAPEEGAGPGKQGETMTTKTAQSDPGVGGIAVPGPPVKSDGSSTKAGEEEKEPRDGSLGELDTLEPLLRHIVGSSRLSIEGV